MRKNTSPAVVSQHGNMSASTRMLTIAVTNERDFLIPTYRTFEYCTEAIGKRSGWIRGVEDAG